MNKALSLSRYLELTKPRLTLMAVATVLSSFYIGFRGPVDWPLLINTLWASALVGGGANALNQYLERAVDAKMGRTEKRPLPSGRIDEKGALLFGVGMALVGVLALFFLVNILASLMAAATLLSYLFFYTPLKKRTPLNTLVGALSGAMPALIGWSAARSSLDLKAFALFLFLFMWQLPHFFTIAWVYREDYKKGSLKMLTESDPCGKKTSQAVFLSCLCLFLASILPTLVGLTGLLYLSAAVFTGLLSLAFSFYLATYGFVYSKEFVNASIFYLAVLNIFMIFDKL